MTKYLITIGRKSDEDFHHPLGSLYTIGNDFLGLGLTNFIGVRIKEYDETPSEDELEYHYYKVVPYQDFYQFKISKEVTREVVEEDCREHYADEFLQKLNGAHVGIHFDIKKGEEENGEG